MVQIDNFQSTLNRERVYSYITETTERFFQSDVFTVSDGYIAICIPHSDLDRVISQCNQLRKDIDSIPIEKQDITISIGLSSRNQRKIEADTLHFETQMALLKAQQDGMNQVVAFRADPQKYKDVVEASG